MNDVTANKIDLTLSGERELLRRRYASHFKPFYQDNLMAIRLSW